MDDLTLGLQPTAIRPEHAGLFNTPCAASSSGPLDDAAGLFNGTLGRTRGLSSAALRLEPAGLFNATGAAAATEPTVDVAGLNGTLGCRWDCGMLQAAELAVRVRLLEPHVGDVVACTSGASSHWWHRGSA